jgi:hypothetical protein
LREVTGRAGRRRAIVRCAVSITQAFNEFRWIDGTRDWRIEGAWEHKVQTWKEEARMEQEESQIVNEVGR